MRESIQRVWLFLLVSDRALCETFLLVTIQIQGYSLLLIHNPQQINESSEISHSPSLNAFVKKSNVNS